MEPRIQYAKTSDGVDIAYSVLGEGTPLVLVSGVFGRLHMYARGAGALIKLEDSLVAEGFTVLIYDGRGMGFSDRGAADFSATARLLDLEAAVDAAGFQRFVVAVTSQGIRAAVRYATEHRQKVTHFVASNIYTAFRELYETYPITRLVRGLTAIASEEWELVTLTMARTIFEYADNEQARAIAAAYRDSMTSTAFLAYLEASEQALDISLPSVDVPSLVIYDRSMAGPRAREIAQKLAPRIPGARFVETDNAARAIREFVRGASTQEKTADPYPATVAPSGTAIILFVDIVDSTALTERLGDAVFRDRARDVAAALRSVIAANGGRTIEGPTLGDGVLATFASARQAIEAALACGEAGAGAGLPLHLGLHAGDVMREKDPDGRDNVYGGAVNIASRISGLSAPGEVLVSETVRSLARTSAGVAFEDRGEQTLKGVAETVRVWAVVAAQETEDRKQETGGA